MIMIIIASDSGDDHEEGETTFLTRVECGVILGAFPPLSQIKI